MAERVDHGNNRWMIVYGDYAGVEKTAVNEVYRIISQYVPYVLTVVDSAVGSEALRDMNVLLTGTVRSNRYLQALAERDVFAAPRHPEGYILKVTDNPYAENRKLVILCGADPSGALYAVRDFQHLYVARQRYNHFNAVYNIPYRVFVDPMPDVEMASAPAFPLRGAWSWGHTIRDYRGYIDHMSLWKLNCLTLWNDFPPVNARDVIDYAHERGIRVIWGYTWCWGEKADPNDPEDVRRWSERVLDTFERQYLPLGVDGIYFQTFTEHAGDAIGGRSTAALAADWVNRISAPLLARYPSLWLQFGLHAASVSHDLDALAAVDPRISIIWEDFPAFPFHHDPQKTQCLDTTVALVEKTSTLRGAAEAYGLVLKGLTMTNWLHFENQKGAYVLGESTTAHRRAKALDAEYIWRYANTYWQKNLFAVLACMRAVRCAGNPRTLMSALLEDGMWEDHAWEAGALFAEAAWNPTRTEAELLEIIHLSQERPQ